MKKIITRDMATSLTTLGFAVVGISGIMMFFHFFDNYVKEMHEILGLVFVGIVFFHVFFNWKSMKNYFSKKVFLLSVIVAMGVVVGFTSNAPTGPNPKGIIIQSVLNAPLEDSVGVLGLDMEVFELKLKNANIILKEEASLNQLAKANKISPYKLVAIIKE